MNTPETYRKSIGQKSTTPSPPLSTARAGAHARDKNEAVSTW
jgi:hypothetical protein